jgi:hypothetical protein
MMTFIDCYGHSRHEEIINFDYPPYVADKVGAGKRCTQTHQCSLLLLARYFRSLALNSGRTGVSLKRRLRRRRR